MCIVCGPGTSHLLRAIVRGNAPPAHGPRFSARAVAPPIVPPLDPASTADLAGPADVILLGGPILTMERDAPEAEAVAVRAGRIQAVGDAAEVLARRGRLTRVIDLAGRTLAPGLVEPHWHMPFTLLCEWSEGEVPQALAGEWIVVRTHPGDIEAAAPDNPLVVVDAEGAVIAGNGRARGSGELPAHVSGLLSRFPVSPGPMRRRLAAVLAQVAAQGMTTLRVCGLGALAGAEDLDLMRAVAEAAPVRLRGLLDIAQLPEWQGLQLSPGFGDDLFRVDALSAWRGETADAAGWPVVWHDAADAGAATLAASTIGAARRCGLDGILGSIARGKYADFAFFTGDPRNADRHCVGTWVFGREVFRA